MVGLPESLTQGLLIGQLLIGGLGVVATERYQAMAAQDQQRFQAELEAWRGKQADV